MECSTWSCRRPSRKHSARRGNRFSRLSVCRSNKAPPSELIVPPSNWATISREPKASNPKRDWLHSVIAKAVLSLAPTVVWKLSYAMKDGLLPIAGEKCGLGMRNFSCVEWQGNAPLAVFRGNHVEHAFEFHEGVFFGGHQGVTPC